MYFFPPCKTQLLLIYTAAPRREQRWVSWVLQKWRVEIFNAQSSLTGRRKVVICGEAEGRRGSELCFGAEVVLPAES